MSEKDNGQWIIAEFMGHKVVAGFGCKDELFGAPLLRIDVPETGDVGAFTQFYGLDAVYCITPVSEEVARLTAAEFRVKPVSVYVPDLVTMDDHRAVCADYERQIVGLRQRGVALPAGELSQEIGCPECGAVVSPGGDCFECGFDGRLTHEHY